SFHFVGHVRVENLPKGLGVHVFHPKVGGVAAAVVLAPPGGSVPIEDKLAAVGGIAAPVAPVGVERLLEAPIHRDAIGAENAGLDAPTGGIEDHELGVARPSDATVSNAVV